LHYQPLAQVKQIPLFYTNNHREKLAYRTIFLFLRKQRRLVHKFQRLHAKGNKILVLREFLTFYVSFARQFFADFALLCTMASASKC